MKWIGLTGGIATGKSTVSQLLRARGIPVADADALSREVVQPGKPALAEIAAEFGASLILEDGQLDRQTLGVLVMGDPTARDALEAITHPRIFEAMNDWRAARAAEGHPAAVMDAALMVETGTWRMYDVVLVVRCSPSLQRRRLVSREGFDGETTRTWMSAQLTSDQKIARMRDALAGGSAPTTRVVVIDNDSGLDELAGAVRSAWAAALSG